MNDKTKRYVWKDCDVPPPNPNDFITLNFSTGPNPPVITKAQLQTAINRMGLDNVMKIPDYKLADVLFKIATQEGKA